MSGTRQWIFVMVATALAPAFCEAQNHVPRAAYIPEPVAEAGWMRRVAAQQGVLSNQPCSVCFMGDSLTEFWLHTGRASWELAFAPLQAVNLGLAADRTEHILNRIQRLDFRRANPRLVVLMMGTNNLGMAPPDDPEDVARAMRTAVTMLRAKLPQASILLLTIPPSGYEPQSALRKRIKRTNALLLQTSWPERVRVLQTYPALVDEQDHWRDGFTQDGTHFTAAGYARLADLLAPVVKEMLENPQPSVTRP